MIERELWAQQAAQKLNHPVIHAQRFAFNYGVQMGIEIAKEIAIEKFKWLIEEMKKRPGELYTAEIKLLENIIEYHETLGERKVSDDDGETKSPA